MNEIFQQQICYDNTIINYSKTVATCTNTHTKGTLSGMINKLGEQTITSELVSH